MRHIIVIALAGASLAGCSSVSFDSLKPSPVQLRLESTPPGADARTSLGQSCKTPCSVSLASPPEDGFSVSYSMAKFEPATVEVKVSRTAAEILTLSGPTIEPNPVVAELQPIPEPPKPASKRPKAKKPKPAATGDE
jgi:hypothetical protein